MKQKFRFTGNDQMKWGIQFRQLEMTPDHPLYEPHDYLMGWISYDTVIEGDVYISQDSYVARGSRLSGDVHLFGKGMYEGVDIEGKVVINNVNYTTIENSTIRGIFSSDFVSSIKILGCSIDGVVLLNNRGNTGKDCRAILQNVELNGNLSLTFTHNDKYGLEPQFIHITDSTVYGSNIISVCGRECYINVNESIFRDFEIAYRGNLSTLNITSCNLTETKLIKDVEEEQSRLDIEDVLVVCEPIKLEWDEDGEDSDE